MKTKKLFIAALAAVSVVGLASCQKKEEAPKTYTYRTTTTVSPSNWNELTYQDNNDTQIMSYLGSSFFEFDFKRDAKGNFVDGEYEVKYSAATKIEDASAAVRAKGYNVPEGKTGYAYKITLRDDLKWDDGTAITAADFVYTMKQQLDPAFQNYRADSFYNGSLVLINAKGYAKQGQSGYFSAVDVYSDAEYSADAESKLVWHLGPSSDDLPCETYIRAEYFGFPASYDTAKTAAYLAGSFGVSADTLVAMEGKTIAEIKADATMKAVLDALLEWWEEGEAGAIDFCAANYTFPATSWDTVGIYSEGNAIYIAMENPLNVLNEDGTLNYKAAYNLSSLPLVKESLYEANKVAPAEGSTLWTSTYNSSLTTTASWGPYKLTEFQSGKNYVLEKNENWYGYSMEQYAGQYQTQKISCETVAKYETRLLMFLAGEIDGIGIDVSVADKYKNSEQAIYTPSDYVGSLQLQSSKSALKNRETEGVNKTILANDKFRKAMSLSIDRVAYNNTCTTSSLKGFGLFNSMHYYDVANGGVYRNTDVAKKVLCDVYGVTYTDATLDDDYAKITGFDLTQARQLYTEAYNECLAAGEIKATDKVVLTIGAAEDTEAAQRMYKFFNDSFVEAVKGTPLEGRFELDKNFSLGKTWSNSFRNGAYDICTGGWTGAAWDPGYFLLAYLSPNYMYSKAWDTSSETLEFTMPKQYLEGATEDYTATKSLMTWYGILNGSDDELDWSAGAIPTEGRLLLIAALEKAILTKYYTVPISYDFSAAMISYKISYGTSDYNTFMSYGGIRYMTYNYDDAAWTAYVASQGGNLESQYKG